MLQVTDVETRARSIQTKLGKFNILLEKHGSSSCLTSSDADARVGRQPSMIRRRRSLPLLLWLLAALDAQLVCWQAILRCHDEPDCELAYRQYLAACDGNLSGARHACPSHCIQALIRLNDTRSGPELETCDCAQDALCLGAKRAIEPCLPRKHPGDAAGIGCMEARRRCEEERGCHASLVAYLSQCGQLFNGRRCSSRCRATIQQMLFHPSGALLNRCVCDGVERPFCEVVKDNMSRLCSIGESGVASDQADAEDVYEDEDYHDGGAEREEAPTDGSAAGQRSHGVMVLAFLWILL